MKTWSDTGSYLNIDLPTDFPISILNGLYVLSDRPIESLEYHDVLEIGHCHTGSGIFVVGDKILPFSAGDVSIIAPGEPHLAQSERGTTSSWTFLFLDLSRLLVPRFPELTDFDMGRHSGQDFNNIVSHREHEQLNQIVRTLVREAKYKKRNYQAMIRSYLAAFAATLERDFPSSPRRESNDGGHAWIGQVRSAVEYIAGHYYEPISVSHLAALCNMSQRNFSRRFAAALRRPAHEYIAETRVAMACGLLLRNDLAIANVAEQCGFLSISAFNRTFKRITGIAPRQWRVQRGTRSPA